MPIYEYRCESCGHELEAIQKMSDIPRVDCPACGEASLKKLISAVSFRLKGSGWYETDFKSGNKKNLHDTGEGSSKDGNKDNSSKDSGSKDKNSKGSGSKDSSKDSSKKSSPPTCAKTGTPPVSD